MARVLLALAAGSAAASTVHNVLSYGADSTGATPSTPAVHRALAAIAAAGGGTLYFPPGHYSSAPLNLTSNTVLLLDFATLRASTHQGDFKLVAPLPSYGEGRDKLPNDLAGRFQPFVGIYNASNVSITTNSSGILHGSGEVWWAAKDAGLLQNTPPHLIEAAWSTGLSFGAPPGSPQDALVFESSPFWNLHIYTSDNAWVHDVSILADPTQGNTDGVDPDSSSNVLIERVLYVGGDDGVAVKSGWDQAGIDYGIPSVNISVRDSSFTTQACCVCIGSEMSGGARNVSVHNVSCVNVGNAFQVKTTPGRGGYVQGFSVTDSTITGASTGLMIMMTYGDHPQPPLTWNASALPVLNDFYYARIKGTGVQTPGSLNGSPGAGAPGSVLITGVRLEDIDLGYTRNPWKCENVTGTSSNVQPQPCAALGGR